MHYLSKIFVRPANIATLIGYDSGIGDSMRKYLGGGFKNLVFFVNSGSMQEFRSQKETEKLKKIIKNIFFTKSGAVKKILNDFNNYYSKIEKLYIKSKYFSVNTPPNEIVKLIIEFEYYYKLVWPPVLFAYWLPLWINPKMLSRGNRERLEEIIKERYKKDKEYVYSLKFYDNIFSYLKKNIIINGCDFELCTPKELIRILKTKKCARGKIEKINKRKNGCIIFRGDVIPVDSISVANKYLEKYGLGLTLNKKVAHIKNFKGQIACKGKKIGKVKLLYAKKDLRKIKRGDVIVSPMTVPYFETALIKAVAIITDEGGITTHASIFAREFNIPCIVGTKIATQVLRDGDLVEVDANKGIIKILKQ